MFLTKSKKTPYYQITYEVNGKRTTISTKAKQRKEAEKFLEAFINLKREIESEENISKKQSTSGITLSEFKNEYIKYVTPTKSKSYIRSIELSFKQFESFIGNILINNITVKVLDQFVTVTFSRTESGAHLYFRTLKAAFSKAVSWDYLQENPFKKIKFPRIPQNYPAFISVEEFNLILVSTQEEYLKDLFTVGFYTGMRRGEIINMKFSWINLSKNIITIKNDEVFQTKSKKERIIPFNQNLRNIFLQYMSKSERFVNDEFVFTNSCNIKLKGDFVSKKFKKSVRKVGFNDRIHFHTLRHSFASMLVQKGVSLYVVKELLGHEDLTTTQIYSHLQQDNLEKAIALL